MTSLERIVPWQMDPSDPVDASVLDSHMRRYRWASGFVADQVVVDCACGVGYGSALLLEEGGARTVTGVDLDGGAITLARDHFGDACTFVHASYAEVTLEAPPDVIVSMETLEHLPDPADFLAFCARTLRPEGLLVGSVPITPSVDFNPYHLHDFTRRSLGKALTRAGFTMIEQTTLVDPVPLSTAFRALVLERGKVGGRTLRPRIGRFYLRHPGKLLRRVGATLRYGLDVHYLLFAARRT